MSQGNPHPILAYIGHGLCCLSVEIVLLLQGNPQPILEYIGHGLCCLSVEIVLVLQGNPPPLRVFSISRSLLFATGDVWRRQRHTLTPTFSASKLKHVSPCAVAAVAVVAAAAVRNDSADANMIQ